MGSVLSKKATAVGLAILCAGFQAATVDAQSLDLIAREYQGTWSTQCNGADAPELHLNANRIIVVRGAEAKVLPHIMVTNTLFGGSKAIGDQTWLLAGQNEDTTDFIVSLPPLGMASDLTLAEGFDGSEGEFAELYGIPFFKCDASGDGAAGHAQGIWLFGTHQTLGRGAWINDGGETLAIRCNADATPGNSVSKFLSPGLANELREGGTVGLFDRVIEGSGLGPGGFMLSRRTHGMFEAAGGFCDTDIEALMQGSNVVFFERDGRVRRTLSLRGSGKALRALIDECPLLREDIENNCGI